MLVSPSHFTLKGFKSPVLITLLPHSHNNPLLLSHNYDMYILNTLLMEDMLKNKGSQMVDVVEIIVGDLEKSLSR